MVQLAPLKETRFYKDVFTEGEIKGVSHEIQTLEDLRAENILNEEQFLARVLPLREELKKLKEALVKD